LLDAEHHASRQLSSSTWNQIQKLVASNGAKWDEFGYSVTVSGGIQNVCGSEGVIARYDASGSAYIYNATTGAQLHKFVPTDGAAGDEFGLSVAVSGDMVVIGARGNADKGCFSRSTHVFIAAAGDFVRKLVASDGSAYGYFGRSVAQATWLLLEHLVMTTRVV